MLFYDTCDVSSGITFQSVPLESEWAHKKEFHYDHDLTEEPSGIPEGTGGGKQTDITVAL